MTKSEDTERLPFFLQNMSVCDDDNEPRIMFTLYDIKDDYSSKRALTAKRRLRYTNVHGLICPQEKMFLTTACDYFLADYDDLIDYIDAIGEMRNKQIIVEHCYFKLFMHTLKMFYYTDKGWRFNIEFDEFFSGYLRKYREPIIERMQQNWNNAKKAAAAARQAAQARMTELAIKTDQV
uniref:BTB domain-containing protein n=1 Tax=Caenorhabditis tropicalis TaxID=1561998 RepID=A0A1I7TCU2_9PELO